MKCPALLHLCRIPGRNWWPGRKLMEMKMVRRKAEFFSFLKILFYLGLNEILGGHIVKFKLDWIICPAPYTSGHPFYFPKGKKLTERQGCRYPKSERKSLKKLLPSGASFSTLQADIPLITREFFLSCSQRTFQNLCQSWF